jgi:hypothetical protein
MEKSMERTSKTVKEGEKKMERAKKNYVHTAIFCWRGEEKQNGTMNYYYLGVLLCYVALCCCSYRLQNYYDSSCRKTMGKLEKQAIMF